MNGHIPSYEVTCFKENVSYFSCSGDDAAKIPKLVMDLQEVKDQYSRLGTQLQVPPYQISAWDNKYNRDADIILLKILEFLFANRKNPYEILWSALTNIDRPRLAQRLKVEYGQSQGNAIALIQYFYCMSCV